MAQFNLTYYKNEDKYSDGDIEDKILYMAEHGIGLDDINPETVNFLFCIICQKKEGIFLDGIRLKRNQEYLKSEQAQEQFLGLFAIVQKKLYR